MEKRTQCFCCYDFTSDLTPDIDDHGRQAGLKVAGGFQSPMLFANMAPFRRRDLRWGWAQKTSNFQKIPAPIRIKLALPSPKKNNSPPPQKKKNEEFYGHGGFPAERTQKSQVPIELAQPLPAQNCGWHEFFYFRVQWFAECPWRLHWTAFPVENSLPKPSFTEHLPVIQWQAQIFTDFRCQMTFLSPTLWQGPPVNFREFASVSLNLH